MIAARRDRTRARALCCALRATQTGAIVVALLAALPASAATFTVTSTANAGTGTLRNAIAQANAAAGADTIVFNIPGSGVHNIGPTSSLPPLGSNLTIDATTQPGYAGSPLIELDGAVAGTAVHGLLVNGSGVTIRGLAIFRYTGDGVRIQTGGGNRVSNCWIGLFSNGITAAGNNNGIWIDNTASNTVGPGNTISGNRVDGVRIHGASATGNIVAGNRIGTDPTGAAALGNTFNGVTITSASANTIGGSTPTDLNVISGNTRYGVGLGAGANGNLVARNYIGLDANGDLNVPNIRSGVLILDSSNNRVGGDVPGTFNVISGNSENGVEIRGALATGNLVQRNVIGADLAGNVARSNFLNGVLVSGAPGNTIGAATPQPNGSNLISGNAGAGVRLLAGADNTIVQGNRIGTNLAGTAAMQNDFGIVAEEADGLRLGVAGNGNLIAGNFAIGILTEGSSNVRIESNLIGTRLDGAGSLANGAGGIRMTVAAGPCTDVTIGGLWGTSGNLISGNRSGATLGSGISLDCNNVTIKGNRIGTNLAGTGIIANDDNGVFASGSNLAVGGVDHSAWACDRECNLVAGNASRGIVVVGSGSVRGNFVGVRLDGNAALPNRSGGIVAQGAFAIGGAAAGAGNLIAGNFGDGLEAFGEDADTVTVQGNRIGTNAAGTTGLANGSNGIEAIDVRTVIGGADHDAGVCNRACNLIGLNRDNGIAIDDFGNNYAHSVKGNFIGTSITGACIGNEQHGVHLTSVGAGASVGGPGATDGNLIACNDRAGISMNGDGARVEFRRNGIHSNGELGIDLFGVAGVDNNDGGDADSGPNGLQNFPVLASAVRNGSTLTVSGQLDSIASRAYTVDFYRSAACDASAHGEGTDWIGASSATTAANGIASIAANLTGTFALGEAITATATAPSGGGTSEFSACVTVTAPPTPGNFALSAATYSVGEGSGVATITVTRTSGTAGGVSVDYATTNGSAITPADYQASSGTLTFGPGATVMTFNVSIANDTLDEADEAFSVTLSSPTGGATLGSPSTAVVTIIDDDAAPAVAVTDRNCVEGNAGSTACAFSITLSSASGRAVSGNAFTANGTAAAGSDYTALAGSPWSIAAGASSTVVNVTVLGDVQDEANETFLVNLTGLTNAAPTGNDVQATGTIVDDDQPVPGSLRFVGSATRTVAEGIGQLTLQVERVGGSDGAVGLSYATVNGTATAPADYQQRSGTLAWTAGDVAPKSITVPIVNDLLSEPPERFIVIIDAPTGGASLGFPDEIEVTILDDESEIFRNGFE